MAKIYQYCFAEISRQQSNNNRMTSMHVLSGLLNRLKSISCQILFCTPNYICFKMLHAQNDSKCNHHRLTFHTYQLAITTCRLFFVITSNQKRTFMCLVGRADKKWRAKTLNMGPLSQKASITNWSSHRHKLGCMCWSKIFFFILKLSDGYPDPSIFL